MLSVLSFGFGGVLVAQAATFTAAEVATHNTAADCWVIVDGNVYNLTSFINTHPGGSSVIIAQCGNDGTASFNSGPHTASSLSAISSLMLGALSTTSTTTPVLTSVTLSPTGINLLIGSTLPLVATPKDQNDVNFSGATTTFTSDNLPVATVDSLTGVVTGVSAGTVNITATSVSGSVTVTATTQILVSTVVTTLPGTLAAQDFGVVNDTVLKGYSAGFGLTDATLAGAQSVVVQLYNGTTLLQTNTAILPKFNADITGVQFSSPFDVSGTFDYVTDGYWTNMREAQYGQSVAATRVVATVTLANGKVVTAENTSLTGDPTTIFSTTIPPVVVPPGNGHGHGQGNDGQGMGNNYDNHGNNNGGNHNNQKDNHSSYNRQNDYHSSNRQDNSHVNNGGNGDHRNGNQNKDN